MSKLHLKYLLLLVICLPWYSYSQEVMDFVTSRASYEFYSKKTPKSVSYKKDTDLIYLDMGSKAAKFYSRYEAARDSAMRNMVDIKKLSIPYTPLEAE